MSPKEPKIKCPRCHIAMTKLYERSYGAIKTMYECPKCKGIVKK